MKEFIAALRKHLHHDHPECLDHYYHAACDPMQVIEHYRCGYQITELKSENPYAPENMLLFCEDRAPHFPIALFTPLTEEQYSILTETPVLLRGVFEIRVALLYSGGEADPRFPYIGIYASLDSTATMAAYLQMVGSMEKELAKVFVENRLTKERKNYVIVEGGGSQ